RAPLPWLLVAPWLLDLLWPVFLLTGVERVRPQPSVSPFLNLEFVSYPWSHSLLMAIVWSAVFGGIYFGRTRDDRGARIVGLLVLSHWVFDWIVHVPDLPLTPGPSVRVGLGLWRFPAFTMGLEGLMFVAGLAVYVSATRAKGRTGDLALVLFVAVLLGMYWMSLAGAAPPSVLAIALTMLVFGAVVVLWSLWIERHRELRPH
ncbi:MAG: hypothetical protein ABI983_09055, partial [Acidobacteriota bacterium]